MADKPALPKLELLGICGSPRRHGNTETLLDAALAGASAAGCSTTKILLNPLDMVSCQECPSSPSDGNCQINDDWQPVFKSLTQASAVIWATPIFFGSLSAQSKIAIDRLNCYWLARFQYKTVQPPAPRAGAFIAVSSKPREVFFDNARMVCKNLFATLGIEYRAELYCPGLTAQTDATLRNDCLQQARELGITMAKNLQQIHSGVLTANEN